MASVLCEHSVQYTHISMYIIQIMHFGQHTCTAHSPDLIKFLGLVISISVFVLKPLNLVLSLYLRRISCTSVDLLWVVIHVHCRTIGTLLPFCITEIPCITLMTQEVPNPSYLYLAIGKCKSGEWCTSHQWCNVIYIPYFLEISLWRDLISRHCTKWR